MSRRRLPFITALVVGVTATAGSIGAQVRARPPQPQAPATRDGSDQQPAHTGVIAGSVVTADTGRPVRRARVSLSSQGSGGRSLSTDDEGRFSFGELPAGQYTLSASKPGLLDVTYGQKRPGSGRPGTPLQLAAAQKLDSIKLGLPRGGVITGLVIDERGEPAFGVQVRALRSVMKSGERTLVGAGSATTDDRGIYRITSLLPGDYIVTAAARLDPELAMAEELKARVAAVTAMTRERAGGAAIDDTLVDVQLKMQAAAIESASTKTGYASVYYPGTVQMAAATPVRIDVSEERSSVDLPLQLVPMARVSGVVIGDAGVPAGADVRLIDNGVTVPGLNVRSTRANPKGEFSFGEVPPGNYTLIARANLKAAQISAEVVAPKVQWTDVEPGYAVQYFAARPGATPQTLYGTADVSVAGEDVSNLGLSLRPGASVSGSVAFETPPGNPADVTRVRVSLVPVGQTLAGEMAPVPVDANGRFTLRSVLPGRYRLTATGAPGGLMLESAVFAGNDALDLLLEVKGDDVSGGVLTFSSKTTELSGAIQDSSGQPTSDCTIIVFTAEDRFWIPQSRRVQATRPATDGRFAFRGLPAGDYRMIAVTDIEPGEWYDPAFLRELVSASMPVRLGDGERKVQDVRVAR